MKTIKLIVLCLSLLFGGYSAFAQSKAELKQKEAKLRAQLNEIGRILAETPEKDVNYAYYSQMFDSIYKEIEKVKSIEKFYDSLGTIDSKQAEIHQDVQNGKDVHYLADKYLTPEKIAEYKKDIQTRKDRNEKLERDIIPAYMENVKNELNNFTTNVDKSTGFTPIVDLKTVQRNPNYAEELNNYIKKNLSAYGLTPAQKKEVQQQYDQLVNANEKVIKAQKEFNKNQKDIEEFCKLCQGKCGCQ